MIGSKTARAARTGLLAFVWILLGAVVADDVLAQRGGGGRGGGRGQGARGGNNADEIYSIVQVGDEVRIVLVDEVEALAKEIKQANTDAIRKWSAAKKSAQKNDEEFTDPKPNPERFKVLAKSVNGRREATDVRDKYQQKLVASMKGKYCVVQQDGEYKVISKNEIAKIRIEADKKYRKELEEFRKSRGGGDDARASRGERPRPPQMRILPKAFATEKEAHEYINGLPPAEREGPRGREGGDRGERRGGGEGEGRRRGGGGGGGI